MELLDAAKAMITSPPSCSCTISDNAPVDVPVLGRSVTLDHVTEQRLASNRAAKPLATRDVHDFDEFRNRELKDVTNFQIPAVSDFPPAKSTWMLMMEREWLRDVLLL